MYIHLCVHCQEESSRLCDFGAISNDVAAAKGSSLRLCSRHRALTKAAVASLKPKVALLLSLFYVHCPYFYYITLRNKCLLCHCSPFFLLPLPFLIEARLCGFFFPPRHGTFRWPIRGFEWVTKRVILGTLLTINLTTGLSSSANLSCEDNIPMATLSSHKHVIAMVL